MTKKLWSFGNVPNRLSDDFGSCKGKSYSVPKFEFVSTIYENNTLGLRE